MLTNRNIENVRNFFKNKIISLAKTKEMKILADYVARKFLFVLILLMVFSYSYSFIFQYYNNDKGFVIIHSILSLWLSFVFWKILKQQQNIYVRLVFVILLYVMTYRFFFRNYLGINFTFEMYVSFVCFVTCLYFILLKKRWLYIYPIVFFAMLLEYRFITLYIPTIIVLMYITNNKRQIFSQHTIKVMVGVLLGGCVFVLGMGLKLRLYELNFRLSLNALFSIVEIIIMSFLICLFDEKREKERDTIYGNALSLALLVIVTLLFSAVSFVPFLYVGVILFVNMYVLSQCWGDVIRDGTRIIKKKIHIIIDYVCGFFLLQSIAYFGSIWYSTLKDENTLVFYYVNYFDFGYVQRAICGTIFRCILGYRIDEKSLLLGVKVLSAIALFVIFYLVTKLYFKERGSLKSNVCNILLVLMMKSSGFGNNFHEQNVFRFDLYNYCLLLLAIYLIINNKKLIAIPILCFLGVSIHSAFVFILFPAIFIVFAYDIFIENENVEKKKMIIFIISVFLTLVGFCYFQFLAHPYNITSAEQAAEYVDERSGGYIVKKDLDGNYEVFDNLLYAEMSEHITEYHDRITKTMILTFVKFLGMITPLIFLFFYIFYERANHECGITKWICKLIPLAILAIAPCYVIEIDYGRWNTHLLFMLLSVCYTITMMQGKKAWYKNMNKGALITILFLVMFGVMNVPCYGIGC